MHDRLQVIALRVCLFEVWDGTGNGSLHFDAQDLGDGDTNLGCIIENRVLQSALFERVKELEAQGRVQVICPGSLKSMKLRNGAAKDEGFNDWAELVLGGSEGEQRQVTARLVVAADGAMSKTRQVMVVVVVTSPKHGRWCAAEYSRLLAAA